MNSIIKLINKNIRTGDDGYTWGKPAQESNILKISSYKSEHNIIAEQWICSDDKEYPAYCLGETGEKQSLSQVFEKYPEEIFGQKHLDKYGYYLGTVMKLIDTCYEPDKGSLSLQVHPSNGYKDIPAKPEMWFSLSDESSLYIGFNDNYKEHEILDAVNKGTIFEKLNKAYFPKGEKILVQGGLVHAIRYGSFIAEWSKSPCLEDIDKGGLKSATSALADNTDGKIPRIGKVNVEKSMDIMKYANAFKKTNLDDLISEEISIYADEMGNKIDKIFVTEDIIVCRIFLRDKINFNKLGCVSSFFIFKGTVSVGTDLMRQGDQFIVPFSIDELVFHNIGNGEAEIFFWYKPISA